MSFTVTMSSAKCRAGEGVFTRARTKKNYKTCNLLFPEKSEIGIGKMKSCKDLCVVFICKH